MSKTSAVVPSARTADLPATGIGEMVLIYGEVEPDTTCGRWVVCWGAVCGGDSCAGCDVVGGDVADAELLDESGGEVVEEEEPGGGVVRPGLPEAGAVAWPGVVWAT